MDYAIDQPFCFPIIRYKPEKWESLAQTLCEQAEKLKEDPKLGAKLSHAWRNEGTFEMQTAEKKEDYDEHGYSSYRSGISLFSEPWLTPFKEIHEEAFQACYRYCSASPFWVEKYMKDADLENLGLLNHAWVSIYGKGHFIPEHVHTDSHLSWVFYGASDGETGKIIFRNTANAHFRMLYNDDASLFCETWKLPPEVGCFYVFPSFMNHYTEQHQGDEDRIIYSGNFVFRQSVIGSGTQYRMNQWSRPHETVSNRYRKNEPKKNKKQGNK